MSHYKTNLRDIEFNLFEVNRLQDRVGEPPFALLDETTTRDILAEIERLAREDFAASFVDGDRQHLELEDGVIRLPDSVKKSLDAVYDGGWNKLSFPEDLGGIGSPPSLNWAVEELLVGANPGIYFYVSGGLMSSVLLREATPDQIERIVRPAIERNWGGTMVLTEPDAGSDVGAGTTKAKHVEGDTWHIEGVKRFITSGESDYHENILHLVLARREGGPPGSKGLSMFIVPKFLVNEDGSPGERNGVVATGVEDKMGIRASATCELSFGVDKPAVGYLVGDVHEGIRQMFLVIEHARMLIGVKSMATLSTGYLNALEYAKERVQGPNITRAGDKNAPRVRIIEHPNVRRLLMLQKSQVEGMRALVYYTAALQDQLRAEPDNEALDKRIDLLLPLIKGYCSERAYDLLGESLQVFGGSGFTRDYPMEQYIRDAKIDTLYEGTTGIQALDLFFRKIVRDQGTTLTGLADDIRETVKGGSGEDPFTGEREALGEALEEVQSHLNAMIGPLMASQANPEEIYKPALHTNALLESIAEVVIAWQMIRHAEVAEEAKATADKSDRGFYAGKIAAMRFFVKTVLPGISLRRRLAETENAALMQLPEAAF